MSLQQLLRFYGELNYCLLNGVHLTHHLAHLRGERNRCLSGRDHSAWWVVRRPALLLAHYSVLVRVAHDLGILWLFIWLLLICDSFIILFNLDLQLISLLELVMMLRRIVLSMFLTDQGQLLSFLFTQVEVWLLWLLDGFGDQFGHGTLADDRLQLGLHWGWRFSDELRSLEIQQFERLAPHHQLLLERLTAETELGRLPGLLTRRLALFIAIPVLRQQLFNILQLPVVLADIQLELELLMLERRVASRWALLRDLREVWFRNDLHFEPFLGCPGRVSLLFNAAFLSAERHRWRLLQVLGDHRLVERLWRQLSCRAEQGIRLLPVEGISGFVEHLRPLRGLRKGVQVLLTMPLIPDQLVHRCLFLIDALQEVLLNDLACFIEELGFLS